MTPALLNASIQNGAAIPAALTRMPPSGTDGPADVDARTVQRYCWREIRLRPQLIDHCLPRWGGCSRTHAHNESHDHRLVGVIICRLTSNAKTDAAMMESSPTIRNLRRSTISLNAPAGIARRHIGDWLQPGSWPR